MEDRNDWQAIENSSTENRELGEVLRQLEGLHHGGTPLDWQEPRQRRGDALASLLIGCSKSLRLPSLLEGTEYEIGGDEHHLVHVVDQSERVYKITHSDSFGCFSQFLPSDPELTGRHFYATVNEDPLLYIRRWMLLNTLGEYQTRYEGLLWPQVGLLVPRICVSQPFLESENPSESEIATSLAQYAYQRISVDTYLNMETNILLADAAPRNVRIINGVPVPFDAIASFATPEILRWVGNTAVG
ncbi:MAG: hypothetical protein WAL87_04940 [Chthoniobacterales bacterium]